jgi:RimJ/RimL family protein N-acetyltransferase
MAAEDGTGSAEGERSHDSYAARPMSIALRTDRLWLRPISPDDREALHRIWTEPEVRRFLWDDRVIDLATVDGVIERSASSFAAEAFGLLALRESEAGALLGTCGLYRVAKGAEPELLYSLAPAAFGRGLATEAARAVLDDALTRLRLPRVLARADVPNRASVRVMERLGMAYAGEREEGGLRLVSYTLASEDWRRR